MYIIYGIKFNKCDVNFSKALVTTHSNYYSSPVPVMSINQLVYS